MIHSQLGINPQLLINPASVISSPSVQASPSSSSISSSSSSSSSSVNLGGEGGPRNEGTFFVTVEYQKRSWACTPCALPSPQDPTLVEWEGSFYFKSTLSGIRRDGFSLSFVSFNQLHRPLFQSQIRVCDVTSVVGELVEYCVISDQGDLVEIEVMVKRQSDCVPEEEEKKKKEKKKKEKREGEEEGGERGEEEKKEGEELMKGAVPGTVKRESAVFDVGKMSSMLRHFSVD